MSENKSRMTLREAFAATRRGYSILWKAMPKIFPVSLAKNALTALSHDIHESRIIGTKLK